MDLLSCHTSGVQWILLYLMNFLVVHCNEAPRPSQHHYVTSALPLVSSSLPLVSSNYSENQFIPKARWSPVHGPLVFKSTEELEAFRERMLRVHNQLLNVTYNSANSLIRLYHDYKQQENDYDRDLGKFYLNYTPLVHDNHLNCVGLTIKLRKHLVEELHNAYPDIDKYLFYSGGEMRITPGNDLLMRKSLRGDEKWKHVALALQFTIKDRPGYFFMDQSFNTPVVTLMRDQEYPHEGTFSVPSKYNRDEYHYSLSNNGFINFTRFCVDFLSTSARVATGGFYLRQVFDSILDITEKRAVIKQKRCIVSRLPGMLRPLDVDVLLHNGTVVEIYEVGKYFPQFIAGKLDLAKMNLSDPGLGLGEDMRQKMVVWGETLRYPKHGFMELIRNLTVIAQDHHFLAQLRRLDNAINIHSLRNNTHYASPEYSGSDELGGTDVLYDQFMQYINTLSSNEVLEMWKTYRQVAPSKDGTVLKEEFPWPDNKNSSMNPTLNPNTTPPGYSRSHEALTKPVRYRLQDVEVPWTAVDEDL